MSRDMVEDLMATVRSGSNELVRQNAYDLLLKLSADGLRAAREAIEVIERTNTLRIRAGHTPADKAPPSNGKDKHDDTKDSR